MKLGNEEYMTQAFQITELRVLGSKIKEFKHCHQHYVKKKKKSITYYIAQELH